MLANIKKPNTKQLHIDSFNGICESYQEPFYICDMLNVSQNDYPTISTRNRYFALRNMPDAQIFTGWELMHVSDNKLYVTMRYIGDLSSGKKSIAWLNNNMLIMPDKLVYNSELDTLKPIEACFNVSQIDIGLADEYMEPIVPDYISATQPNNPKDNDFWLDSNNHRLKRFVGYQGIWNTIESVYTVLKAKNIGTNFNVGECINIKGTNESRLNWNFIVERASNDYIVVLAKDISLKPVLGNISITKEAPFMDDICTWKGRIWGINKQKCELYASKLGEITVFNAFSGLASDSYAMKLESRPISILPLEDELLVFFEQGLLRISGNRPSNFRSSLIANIGIKPNCEHSAVSFRGCAYFVSQDGVYCYNSMLRRINQHCLKYIDKAIGFVFHSKYYLGTEKGLYSYDLDKNIWCKESPYIVDSACVVGDYCYILSNGTLYCLNSEDIFMHDANIHGEDILDWHIESGIFSLRLDKTRILRSLSINMQGVGTYHLELWHSGKWHSLRKGNYPSNINISISIALPRSDKCKIRISGKGKATIYSITQYFL